MTVKLYGSLNNRLDENKNYTGRELKVGDDITMYHWSDRTCYYITKVIDQKHIFVKPYQVCADHSKEGGQGHQNWLYFKTIKEEQAYINDCIDKGWIKGVNKHNLDEIYENSEQEWVFRYGHWNTVQRKESFTNKLLDKPRYHRITQGLSFGIKDYYYDWEF